MNTYPQAHSCAPVASPSTRVNHFPTDVLAPIADRARAHQLLSETEGISTDLFWYLSACAMLVGFGAGLLLGLATRF